MKTFEYKFWRDTGVRRVYNGLVRSVHSDSGDWSSELADSCEQDAIDYIKSKGFTIRGYDD